MAFFSSEEILQVFAEKKSKERVSNKNKQPIPAVRYEFPLPSTRGTGGIVAGFYWLQLFGLIMGWCQTAVIL